MPTSAYYNRVVFIPATGGTGAFTVRSAAPGARTPASASIPDGTTVSYTAVSYDLTQWECGQGTYTAGVLARTTLRDSSTGAFVNFTYAPTVQLDFLAQDITQVFNVVQSLPPIASTDKAITRWSGNSGLIIQNSTVILDDTGNVFLPSGTKLDWGSANYTVTHSAGTLKFSGTMTPSVSGGAALGTGALPWANVFVSSAGTINFGNGNYTLTHSAGDLLASGTFSVGDTNFKLNFNAGNPFLSLDSGDSLFYSRTFNQFLFQIGSTSQVGIASNLLFPPTNDGAALGTGLLSWSDLFLASGGVINWNNGNVTLTQGANVLTFLSSTSLTVNFNAAGNVGLEIGRLDGSSSTPFIDFHSGATVVDYDARLISSGGSGVTGGGTLTVQAASLAVAATADEQQQVKWTGIIAPSQITSDQNDYNPAGLATASTLRLSSDASRNITGLQGGTAGRVIVIHNVGANSIVLKDESASSSAGNRFALTGDATLSADSVVFLQYDGTSARWRCISGGGSSGSLLRQTRFTANGTWNKGTSTTKILAFATGGGGGGGGSSGGGGGGGGTSISVIDVTAVSSYAIVIGGAGSGGGPATPGGAGGDSTINTSTVVGKGGSGGKATDGQGGAGGVAGTGDIVMTGNSGNQGFTDTTDVTGFGGSGGGSFFGGAGRGGTETDVAVVATNYGGGGGGGGRGTSGTAGTAGVVWILEFT